MGDCERGNNAWIYRWAFYYAPLWTTILVSTVMMFLIFSHVRKIEKKTKKYSFNSRREIEKKTKKYSFHSRRKSQTKYTSRVANQAYFFLGAYFITWTPITIVRVTQTFGGKTSFGLTLLASIITPCQGLLNYLVYLRPRFLRCREKNPKWSIGRTVVFLFFPKILYNFFTKTSSMKEDTNGEGDVNAKPMRQEKTSKHSIHAKRSNNSSDFVEQENEKDYASVSENTDIENQTKPQAKMIKTISLDAEGIEINKLAENVIASLEIVNYSANTA